MLRLTWLDGWGMCVLLVEDETLVRLVMAECLRDAGFDVVEAATGDEAIGLLNNPPRPFSGLVTDLHMPGHADGSRVAAHIRQKWPSMPIVIASGRPDLFEDHWKDQLRYYLLEKPYMPSDLVLLLQVLGAVTI